MIKIARAFACVLLCIIAFWAFTFGCQTWVMTMNYVLEHNDAVWYVKVLLGTVASVLLFVGAYTACCAAMEVVR